MKTKNVIPFGCPTVQYSMHITVATVQYKSS